MRQERSRLWLKMTLADTGRGMTNLVASSAQLLQSQHGDGKSCIIGVWVPLLAEQLLNSLTRGQTVCSSKNAIEASIVVDKWAGDCAASLSRGKSMTLSRMESQFSKCIHAVILA